MGNKSFSEVLAVDRSTDGWYQDSDGYIRRAGDFVPRIGYDANGVCQGIMVEPGRTNSCLHAAYLPSDGGSRWSAASGSFVVTPVNSIFDGYTAWKHEHVPGLTRSRQQNVGTFTAGAWDCLSVYVENVNSYNTTFGLRDVTAATWVGLATFNWVTKAMTVGGGAGVLNTTLISSNGPNGGQLYRLSIASAGITSGNTRGVYVYPAGSGSTSNTAIIHGVQLESGSNNVTSFIPSTNVALTRASDTINTAATIAAGGWYATKGTFYVETYVDSWSNDQLFHSLIGFGTSPQSLIRVAGGTIQVHDGTAYRAFSASVATASTYVTGGYKKIAICFEDGVTTSNVACNGVSGTYTNDGGLVNSASVLNIGATSSGSYFHGHIRKIQFIPRLLSLTELAALTA